MSGSLWVFVSIQLVAVLVSIQMASRNFPAVQWYLCNSMVSMFVSQVLYLCPCPQVNENILSIEANPTLTNNSLLRQIQLKPGLKHRMTRQARILIGFPAAMNPTRDTQILWKNTNFILYIFFIVFFTSAMTALSTS